MLKPAIIYKEEIQKKMQEYFYTEDMMFECGNILGNWTPNIENTEDGTEQWAVIDGDEVIGFISYHIDWYASNVSRFGIISFDRNNPVFGFDIGKKMLEFVKKFRRIEWRMVGGNPVERHYDRFCEKFGGTKHILKDAIRDREGNYRDDVIYEIVKEQK